MKVCWHIKRISGKIFREKMSDILALVNSVPNSNWNSQKLFETFCERLEYCLMAVKAGKIVGVLLAYEQEPQEKLGINEKHVFIRRLCVAKEYRGRGIARCLLLKMFTSLTARKAVFLQTNTDNPVNELYSRMGFSRHTTVRIEGHKDNIWKM